VCLLIFFVSLYKHKQIKMIVEYKGKQENKGEINILVKYLESIDDSQLWKHYGMNVELDSTVDFSSQNVLIRWLDINEEFNDRIIVNSLEQFQSHFKMIND